MLLVLCGLNAEQKRLLKDGKSGVMKILGDSLRRNSGDIVLATPGALERHLFSGCCAYVEVSPSRPYTTHGCFKLITVNR